MKQLFLAIILLSVILSCKKSNNPPIVIVPIDTIKPLVDGPIGEQTLFQTKATFQGKWKLHYTIGGYTGTIRVNYPNTIFNFTVTDSVYRWDSNILTINSKVSYLYSNVYIANYSTFILEIMYPNNTMLSQQIAYKKKGDTLILGQPTTQPDYLYLTKQ